MKFSKKTLGNLVLSSLVAASVMTMPVEASAAGLDVMVNGASSMITSVARLMNLGASLVGGWFVFKGVMAWKKSSDEGHGQQVEFKSVVVPIIAGAVLVAFTAFVSMTSATFGFAGNPII